MNQTRQGLSGAAQAALWVGAGGSLVLTLFVGRHNHSIALMMMFALWVLVPFIVAARMRRQWPCIVLAAVSLIIYAGGAVATPLAHPAAVFLLTPLVSLVLLGAVELFYRRLGVGPPRSA